MTFQKGRNYVRIRMNMELNSLIWTPFVLRSWSCECFGLMITYLDRTAADIKDLNLCCCCNEIQHSFLFFSWVMKDKVCQYVLEKSNARIRTKQISCNALTTWLLPVKVLRTLIQLIILPISEMSGSECSDIRFQDVLYFCAIISVALAEDYLMAIRSLNVHCYLQHCSYDRISLALWSLDH